MVACSGRQVVVQVECPLQLLGGGAASVEASLAEVGSGEEGL